MYRIFLAEDDEMLCSLIKKHLESWGYQVTAAEDFRDIMGEFVRSEAHLVLPVSYTHLTLPTTSRV